MLLTQALLRLGAALACLLVLAGPARAGGRAARFLAQTTPSAEVGPPLECACVGKLAEAMLCLVA